MLPLKLTFSGLHSYREPVTIDFSKLNAAGLFGIFGPTGSGKSTILEAMILALYGTSERLGNQGLEDIVNLHTKKLDISFEFKHNEKNYRFIYSNDISKKTPKKEHTSFELSNGIAIPLTDKTKETKDKAESILGSAANFRRTTIIPQGKFSEFLQLKGKDLTSMMEELFDLNDYDIQNQIKNRKKVVDDSITYLNGQLQQRPSTTEEELQQMQQELAALQEQKKALEARLTDLNKQITSSQQQEQKQQQLTNLTATLNQLVAQEANMKAKLELAKKAEKAKTIIGPVLEDVKKYENQTTHYRGRIAQLEQDLQTAKQTLLTTTSSLDQLLPKLAEEPSLRKKIDGARAAASWHANEQLLATTKALVQKYSTRLDVIKGNIKQLEETTTTNDAAIKTLEGQLDAFSVLPAIGAWYKELAMAEGNRQDLFQQWAKTDARVMEFSSQISSMASLPVVTTLGLDIHQPDWDGASQQLNKNLTAAQARLHALQQENGLTAYAHLLHDGEPCPLCGSNEHPSPIVAELIQDAITACTAEIAKLQGLDQQLKQARNEHQLLVQKRSTEQENYSRLKSQIAKSEQTMADLDARFIWQGFSPTDQTAYQQAVTQKTELERQLVNTRQLRDLSSDKLKNERENEAKGLAMVADEQNKLSQLEGANKTLLAQIDSTILPGWNTLSSTDLNNLAQQTELNLSNWKQEQTRLQSALTEARVAETQLATELTTSQNLLEGAGKDLAKAQASLSTALLQHGFQNQQEATDLILHNLELATVEAEFTQFNDKLIGTKTTAESLQRDLATNPFDQEAYALQLQAANECKASLESVNTTSTEVSMQLKSANDNNATRASLAQQREEHVAKQDLLDTLNKLFTANGMVKYIGALMLESVVKTANVQFKKMTRNQLELVLDLEGDKVEFNITDHLNGSAKRSAATLSGGQTFQASLSMALALSELVGHGKQQFFFLDEGFGTQDNESLKVVFNTLEQLQHEGQIVGLISHVDELKDRLEARIDVWQDANGGSHLKVVA